MAAVDADRNVEGDMLIDTGRYRIWCLQGGYTDKRPTDFTIFFVRSSFHVVAGASWHLWNNSNGRFFLLADRKTRFSAPPRPLIWGSSCPTLSAMPLRLGARNSSRSQLSVAPS
jgi:hypothetical protein